MHMYTYKHNTIYYYESIGREEYESSNFQKFSS